VSNRAITNRLGSLAPEQRRGIAVGDPFRHASRQRGSEPTALDFYLYMLVALFPERDHLLAERSKLRKLIEAAGERQSVRRVMPRHLD